jgi:hypothetical protein
MIELSIKLRETREQSDEKRELMICKVEKKIPKLNSIANALIKKLNQPKYLQITTDMAEVLDDVENN